MLVEFRVKNFKSFQNECVLSLVGSSDRSLPNNTLATKSFSKHKLLRSAVLYGPNASGKSNLIAAIAFVQNLVRSSATNPPHAEITVQPFRLHEKSRQSPSEFELTFIHDEIRYQYGFSVDRWRVYSEWLVAYPKGRAQTWFERRLDVESGSYEWYFGRHLKGEKTRLQELTKSSSLFLSVGATFNNHQLAKVYNWFDHYLLVVDINEASERLIYETAKQTLAEPDFHQAIQKFLQVADLGIVDFSVEERAASNPERRRFAEQALDIQIQHQSKGQNNTPIAFSFEEESLGTRRLFAYGGPLLSTLKNGYTLFVDELDASLHPRMLKAFVTLFHDPTLNPHHAQLIFNTHDITLLDSLVFRRDQIWLIEKDRSGASHLYSLLEFSPRKDEALAKGYLQGRYGAVPNLSTRVDELVEMLKKMSIESRTP